MLHHQPVLARKGIARVKSNITFVRTDIAKGRLDAFVDASGELHAIPNDQLGHKELVSLLSKQIARLIGVARIKRDSEAFQAHLHSQE